MLKVNKLYLFVLIAMLLTGLLFISGCAAEEEAAAEPVDEEEPGVIVLGGKGWAENMTLAHMAAILIEENTIHSADTSKVDMGPTEMLHPAIVSDQIDIYPEYTGTSWLVVLEQEEMPPHEEIFGEVRDAYAEQFNLTVLEPLGFENTFAIAMTAERAEELEVSTLSELAAIPGLTFIGDSTTFTRPDVYLGLEETYGLDMEQVIVDTAFFYESLVQEQGDVTTCFSTDGRLKEYGFVVLEDDKLFFPPYDAIYVVRSEIIETYPSVAEALSPLLGSLNEETMIGLNYLVEVEMQDPEDVAREYLEEQGLI